MAQHDCARRIPVSQTRFNLKNLSGGMPRSFVRACFVTFNAPFHVVIRITIHFQGTTRETARTAGHRTLDNSREVGGIPEDPGSSP
jgi:hypothetical protein